MRARYVVNLRLASVIGEDRQDDLYIKDQKVVILGVDSEGNEAEKEAKGAEFSFSETHPADSPPSGLVQSSILPLAQAAVRGVNGLLLVLGQSGSGKSELMHGVEAGGEGQQNWNGLVQECLASLYTALPSDNLSAAESMFSVRVQFLSIVEERVQDLLQPNCHAHDLQLVERAGTGIEVVGADEVEIKGASQGVRLYTRARDELHRLHRYHSVDPATQCTLIRITLHRRGVARGGAVAAAALSSQAAARAALTGEVVSSITLVELPGTERLAEDRARLAACVGLTAAGA